MLDRVPGEHRHRQLVFVFEFVVAPKAGRFRGRLSSVPVVRCTLFRGLNLLVLTLSGWMTVAVIGVVRRLLGCMLLSVWRKALQRKLRITCLLWKCILRPAGRMPMLMFVGLILKNSMKAGRWLPNSML